MKAPEIRFGYGSIISLVVLLLSIIFISSLTLSVYAEEKIDIWNNKKITETSQTKEQDQPEKVNQLNSQAAEKILPSQTIKIENGLFDKEYLQRIAYLS